MSYNNEMSENANVNANVNIPTLDMLEESVSVTVLNRLTNGPIPDYDMDICATNQEVEEVEEDEAEFALPPPPRLQRMNCNFVDYTIDHAGRNVFYFAPQVREFTDEEIQIYNEEDENKIYEIEEIEIVEDYPQEEEMDFDMPAQCPRCQYFDCLNFECLPELRDRC